MQTQYGMLVPHAHEEWGGFKCDHRQDTVSHRVLGGLVLESSSPDIQGCSSPLYKMEHYLHMTHEHPHDTLNHASYLQY